MKVLRNEHNRLRSLTYENLVRQQRRRRHFKGAALSQYKHDIDIRSDCHFKEAVAPGKTIIGMNEDSWRDKQWDELVKRVQRSWMKEIIRGCLFNKVFMFFSGQFHRDVVLGRVFNENRRHLHELEQPLTDYYCLVDSSGSPQDNSCMGVKNPVKSKLVQKKTFARPSTNPRRKFPYPNPSSQCFTLSCPCQDQEAIISQEWVSSRSLPLSRGQTQPTTLIKLRASSNLEEAKEWARMR